MVSENEPPALWEEALEGPDDRAAQMVAEWWERYKDDIPWADSPPGPE